MKRLINLIAFAFLLVIHSTSCAQQKATPQPASSNNPVEIPFTLDVNRLIIKNVKINGQGNFTFIFDTGAQGVVVNESVSQKLQLKGEGFTPLGSPNNPNAYQAKNIDIPVFSVNGFESKNEEAVAVDFAKVFRGSIYDGIFGLSTFKGHLVTINYAESKLVVAKGDLSTDSRAVKVDLSRILALTGKLNEREIPIHFDSGSPSYITLPMEWKKDLQLKAEPVAYAKGMTAGGEFDIFKADLLGTIEVGSIMIKDPEILLKTGGFTTANFGFSFLRNYSITIDMVNQFMLLLPNGANQPNTNKLENATPCTQYAGTYKNREITCEQGTLFMQRIITEEERKSNPQMQIQAPKFKLVAIEENEFSLEQIPSARVKFIKNEKGNMELHVLNPQGQWEKTEKTK